MAALAQISAAAPAGPTANVVDAAGHLRVPADYRTLYQALGSWAMAADRGQGSKEMYAVYASPGAIDANRKTGHFPDGAVLVKEVFATSTNEMTTGAVSHADKLKDRSVMVRDSKGTPSTAPQFIAAGPTGYWVTTTWSCWVDDGQWRIHDCNSGN